MKSLNMPLVLALGASSLLALQPKPTLNCDDRHGDRNRPNFCEIRESTVSAGGGVISIDARQNGGISVKGWDRNDVLVRAQVRTSAATDAEARDLARQVNVQTVGAQIRADGPAGDHDRGWSVTYEVFVPARSSAKLETVNGGISVSDVAGDLGFTAVNGGVTLERVAGNVHGRTTNGGVRIELAGDRWDGQGMDITTVNGGISLAIPQNFSAQLEAETGNGGIHSDVPVVMPASSRREHRMVTSLGAGGSPLRFHTTNGGISIKRL
jgi:DUF4097 and DUF4098 domain-containing protein YvlB